MKQLIAVAVAGLILCVLADKASAQATPAPRPYTPADAPKPKTETQRAPSAAKPAVVVAAAVPPTCLSVATCVAERRPRFLRGRRCGGCCGGCCGRCR